MGPIPTHLQRDGHHPHVLYAYDHGASTTHPLMSMASLAEQAIIHGTCQIITAHIGNSCTSLEQVGGLC